MQLPVASGVVTLHGDGDAGTGLVKGMVLRANPRAVLVDLRGDLAAAIDRFPLGTVHLSLRGACDPGAPGRILVACAARCYWIALDNGALGEVLRRDAAAELRAVDLERTRLTWGASTVAGPDLLGPLAGSLSVGRFGFRALGPRVADPVLRSATPVDGGEG